MLIFPQDIASCQKNYVADIVAAAEKKDIDTLKTILQFADIDQWENSHFDTPVSRLAKNKDYDSIDFLLKHGANPQRVARAYAEWADFSRAEAIGKKYNDYELVAMGALRGGHLQYVKEICQKHYVRTIFLIETAAEHGKHDYADFLSARCTDPNAIKFKVYGFARGNYYQKVKELVAANEFNKQTLQCICTNLAMHEIATAEEFAKTHKLDKIFVVSGRALRGDFNYVFNYLKNNVINEMEASELIRKIMTGGYIGVAAYLCSEYESFKAVPVESRIIAALLAGRSIGMEYLASYEASAIKDAVYKRNKAKFLYVAFAHIQFKGVDTIDDSDKFNYIMTLLMKERAFHLAQKICLTYRELYRAVKVNWTKLQPSLSAQMIEREGLSFLVFMKKKFVHDFVNDMSGDYKKIIKKQLPLIQKIHQLIKYHDLTFAQAMAWQNRDVRNIIFIHHQMMNGLNKKLLSVALKDIYYHILSFICDLSVCDFNELLDKFSVKNFNKKFFINDLNAYINKWSLFSHHQNRARSFLKDVKQMAVDEIKPAIQYQLALFNPGTQKNNINGEKKHQQPLKNLQQDEYYNILKRY